MRYPGHAELIIALQRSGFFAAEPINYKGKTINPLEFTSAVLLNEWKLGTTEEELTIMKVIVKGTMNGQPKTIEYSVLDKYDTATQTSSMSRTTGYTCTAAANAFAEGLFSGKGVFPPELVGKHKACFDYILQYLKERNVNWIKKEY